MVHYRRNRLAGGTYFFTVTLADRRSNLLVDQVDILRASFRRAMIARPFRIVAMVVLPEHLHALWTLPRDDDDYPARWQSIKAGFVRGLSRDGMRVVRNARGECGVWQRRYWEHTIRDDDDLERHVAYIHHNPVKHGLVGRVIDWPYSSFHRYVREGLLSEDWAGAPEDTAVMDWGERR